jgi:hypothetical protein
MRVQIIEIIEVCAGVIRFSDIKPLKAEGAAALAGKKKEPEGS